MIAKLDSPHQRRGRLYTLLGRSLMGRRRLHPLAQSYTILAVGFATLVVPWGLSGSATAAVFALEGAGLVWLGWVQQWRSARIGGIMLQVAAALFWIQAAVPVARENAEAFVVIANAGFIGGGMIALAGLAIAWLYRQHAPRSYIARGAYLWGLGWWLGIAGREILEYGQTHYFLHDYSWRYELHTLLLLLGLTGWLAAARKRHTTRALVSSH
ncbi:DUF2339 domain-containing protein [Cephaloticoccus primus]|uniref:DUF2339 domain-containing protein n=1 Tax=Cephaloticoccus primus TaxID=1548207 RepID=UPI0012E71762|nr:DUF2339 domain-containing protein [Cephaloticoccus primus]